MIQFWISRRAVARSGQESVPISVLIVAKNDGIVEIHAARAAYGAVRITRELRRHGVEVGRRRVARLMREQSIAGITQSRKFQDLPNRRRTILRAIVHLRFREGRCASESCSASGGGGMCDGRERWSCCSAACSRSPARSWPPQAPPRPVPRPRSHTPRHRPPVTRPNRHPHALGLRQGTHSCLSRTRRPSSTRGGDRAGRRAR